MRTALALGFLAVLAAGGDRVLFLTHSAGYQHAVVKRRKEQLALAEKALMDAADGFDVVCTQKCALITRENLARFDAVVFYTTGELPIDREGLIEYVREGGAFIGIHPATDTLYRFAPYGVMVGGQFWGHPWNQSVRIRVEDREHPATTHLGDAFEIKDEIYQFRHWQRGKVHVLLSLDPESVDLEKKGVKRKDRDFAVSWCKPFGRGRVFYTALGHRPEVWRDERFSRHVVNGIRWGMERGAMDDEGFVAFPKRERAYASFLLRLECTAPGSVFVRGQEVELPEAGRYEIACAGTTCQLISGGRVVGSWKDLKTARGRIGLPEGEGAVKDVRIRELSENAAAYHVLADGWKMCGPGGFDEKEGVRTAHGGMGLLWHRRPFKDFVLMLDWKVTRKEDNSGVFVRFPDPGSDPWVAVHKGYEIQICDPSPAKHRTGSVYSFRDARHVPTRPAGEWNHFEIRVVGQKYEVWVNGRVVTDFQGTRSEAGHIGLQNHDDNSPVSFRNVRVVELR